MKPAYIFVSSLFLLLLHTASLALSDNDDNKNPTQQDLNERMYRSFEKADTELNRIYKHLMATLPVEMKTALRIEQRAWLKDRDSKCRQEADEESGGGSMWGMSYHVCRENETWQRIGELEKWKLKGSASH